MNVYDELKWRGLVFQVSSEEKVREYLRTPGRTMYCGFDPTARSLHVGNMVPLLALLRFKRAGHDPIVLLGGATARIGDPSGKDVERPLLSDEEIEANIRNIRSQVHAVFGDETRVFNNYGWTKEINIIKFLRDIGKYFTVNHMMAKESVKNRISRDEVGISYTEFSYMILQALDFNLLYRENDCRLQIGGSDQWGNITAGTELIRKKSNGEAFALTFPLITTASGAKFGKSEKGAVYLDPELTSSYDFYQYWIRTDDRDVIGFLKYFTFLTKEEIDELERAMQAEPERRLPQQRLAAEMTTLVHGAQEQAKIEAAVQVLYGKGNIETVDLPTLKAALQEAPSMTYSSRADIPDLPQILVDLKLCRGKGQARRDIEAGGVYVSNIRIQDPGFIPTDKELLHGRVLLLRKGKKHYGLVLIGEGIR